VRTSSRKACSSGVKAKSIKGLRGNLERSCYFARFFKGWLN
jgi:hypothetical protein